jgi:penicillin-binding protein 1A
VDPGRVTAAIAEAGRQAGRRLRRHPFLWLLLLLSLPPLLFAAYVSSLVPLTPSVAKLRSIKAEQPSVVLTADGKELVSLKRANRNWLKLADISPHVVDALIATEDRRFFDHHGMDILRTIGAAYHTFRGDLQGGSTITQQLARNLYPDEIGRAPTINRKLKEAITALKIESAYSKGEILETYLNTVPFLYNAWGIDAAARTYFDKSAHDLNVVESATLIGMLKGTTYYNPVSNPKRATQRRNLVLAQMVKDNRLPAADLDDLRARPLGLNFERQDEPVGPAPHVAQQMRRWLIEWADRHGYDVYTDGLVVRTTIDSRLQALANEALVRQADKLQVIADASFGKRTPWARNRELAASFVRESPDYANAVAAGLTEAQAQKKLLADTDFMEKLWRGKTQLQAGFMALDPGTGQIRAWVGSRDFQTEQFDHVAQARRQPGSTFKPFVYGAAFEQGISPGQTFMDEPQQIRIDANTVWTPKDVEPPSGLPMTLREALIHSKNTITSQLVQQVGADRVAKVAYAMGVRQSKLDAVPSLALGTSPVTLREMVSAFGSIANGGNYVEPMLVTAVEDRQQHVLERFAPGAPEQALARTADQTLLDVMRGVVDRGTGAGIRQKWGMKGDLAGKTGTTQDNTDGWFILMHPQLVGGAWVGFDDNRVTMRGDWGQGAHGALHIVGDFFQQTIKANYVDAKARFAAPHTQEEEQPLMNRMGDWLSGLLPAGNPQPTAQPEPSYPQPAESRWSADTRSPPRSAESADSAQPAYTYPPAQPSWRQQRADGAVVVRPDLGAGGRRGDGWAAAQVVPVQPPPLPAPVPVQPEYAARPALPPAQPVFIVPRSAATDASGHDLGSSSGDRPERGWPIIRGTGG